MKPHYYVMPALKYPVIYTKKHEETLAKVSDYYGVSIDEMKGESRKREYVLARHLSMAAIYSFHNWSLVSTGKLFNRHHTSVIHAIQAVKDLCLTDENYKSEVNNLFPSLIPVLNGKKDYKRW